MLPLTLLSHTMKVPPPSPVMAAVYQGGYDRRRLCLAWVKPSVTPFGYGRPSIGCPEGKGIKGLSGTHGLAHGGGAGRWHLVRQAEAPHKGLRSRCRKDQAHPPQPAREPREAEGSCGYWRAAQGRQGRHQQPVHKGSPGVLGPVSLDHLPPRPNIPVTQSSLTPGPRSAFEELGSFEFCSLGAFVCSL